MEKHNWNTGLGMDMIHAYDKARRLDTWELKQLGVPMSYPEKFWKIANFYYNSGKSWIPGKNQEKLEKVIAQEKEKQHFLNEVFRDVSHLH